MTQKTHLFTALSLSIFATTAVAVEDLDDLSGSWGFSPMTPRTAALLDAPIGTVGAGIAPRNLFGPAAPAAAPFAGGGGGSGAALQTPPRGAAATAGAPIGVLSPIGLHDTTDYDALRAEDDSPSFDDLAASVSDPGSASVSGASASDLNDDDFFLPSPPRSSGGSGVGGGKSDVAQQKMKEAAQREARKRESLGLLDSNIVEDKTRGAAAKRLKKTD